jgi:tetratricopeptide (TPR) repeat protein
LGPDQPATIRSLQNLGVTLRDNGDLEEAEPLLREALKRQTQNCCSEIMKVASALNSMGELLLLMRQREETKHFLTQILAIYSKQNGPEHKATKLVANRLNQLRHDAP